VKGLSPIKAVYINIQRAHIAKLWSVVVDDHLFKAKMWTSSYDEAVDSGIADGAPKSDGVVCHPGYDLTTCLTVQSKSTLRRLRMVASSCWTHMCLVHLVCRS